MTSRPSCLRCQKTFRDLWTLSRHMSRAKQCEIIQCIQVVDTVKQDDSLLSKMTPIIKQDDSLLSKMTPIIKDGDSLTCKYCIRSFYDKATMKRHCLTCKSREDPVRLLEIEQGILPVVPGCKTECRYCNKIFSRVSSLNSHLLICKAREEYNLKLLKPSTVINNNTTNNNCNITNIGTQNNLVLNFGQSNLDHIDTEEVIDMLRKLIKENPDSSTSYLAGRWILEFDKKKNENPVNRNIIVPYPKSQYVEIGTSQGMEKVPATRYLNTDFKYIAGELSNMESSMEECDNRIFKKFPMNKEILNHTKGFNKKGYIHDNNMNGNDRRELKSAHKISKLRDRIIGIKK